MPSSYGRRVQPVLEKLALAARSLAERMLDDCADDADTRIAWGFREVLTRPPEVEERLLLKRLLEQELGRFQVNPEAATRLLSVGARPAPPQCTPAEFAAWTSVARVLLNLSETLTRF